MPKLVSQMKRQNVSADEEGKPSQKQEQKYKPIPQQDEEEHPPLNIVKDVMGQGRDYYYLTTVKSVKEMDEFRFKNCCRVIHRKSMHTFESIIMPCSRKRSRKGCDFELMGICPNLAKGNIHIYAHSQHNHLLMPEEKRSICKREKELMPDANPPATFCTTDNIEFTFLQTFPDYDEMQKFRRESQCYNLSRSRTCRRIRFPCVRKSHCKFMLMAMRSTEERFHVYKHGEHEHNKKLSNKANNSNLSKYIEQSVGSQQNMKEHEKMEDEDKEGKKRRRSRKKKTCC